MILLCLAAAVPLPGRTQSPDEGSVPEPTRMAVMASRLDARVATIGHPGRVESNDAVAEIAAIEVNASAERTEGLRLDLRNEAAADSIYLDPRQAIRLRDDFAHLEQMHEQACDRETNCAFGIARCRPSQDVEQALCPTAYSTAEGGWGVSISTPEGLFLFPGLKPADFSRELATVIEGLDAADTVVSR